MSLHSKAYRFRFYPTEDQAVSLGHTFGCCRWVYNHFLNKKSTKWKEEKKSISYSQMSKELTELKAHPDHLWLKDISSVPLQQILRHLDKAFASFFKKRGRYPKFKSKRSDQSCTFMKTAFRYKDGSIFLAKCNDPLKIVFSRKLPVGCIPSSVTVSLNASGQYHISILVEEEIAPLSFNMKEVGIDLGLTSHLTLNSGMKIAPHRSLKQKLKRLKRLQKSFFRKKKGSNNRNKARQTVAKLHLKVKNARHDHLHKLSTKIVHENQVIAVEDLSVKKMLKDKRLSRQISDASWGVFLQLLEYKAKWFGRMFVQVGKYFPSTKQCSSCGTKNENLHLGIRSWECATCKVVHDRDVNAAINILQEGKRLLAEKFSTVPRGSRDLVSV